VSGMLCINDWATVPLIQSLPFGGVKLSGFGRFNGPEGLRGFSRQKSVVSDRFSGLLTRSPAILNYPLPAVTVPLLPSVIRTVYGRSVSERLLAAAQIGKRLLLNAVQKKAASLEPAKKSN